MNIVKYSNDTILDKAFEIAINDGFSNISVRRVAKLVGCSTSPIYTAFTNIENLIEATKEKALNIIEGFVEYRYTENDFLNIGVGKLHFATKYPSLYKELFIDHPKKDIELRLRKRYFELLSRDLIAQFMTEKELEIILTKLWLVTHGLATMIVSSTISTNKIEDYISILAEVGYDLIIAMLTSKGNINEYLKEYNKPGNNPKTSKFNWKIWKEEKNK